MALIIQEWCGLVGLDGAAPATFPELLTWLATLVVGLVLTGMVIRLVGVLVRALCDFRRW